VHLFDFPKKWFVISVDNPDDSAYQLDTMDDAAGLRRQLHLYTEINVQDFLDYAIDQKFHPSVIEYVQTYPHQIYDMDSQKLGAVFANPASYEKLSDHMWKFDMMKQIDNSFDDIEAIAGGLLNVSQAAMFIEFLKEGKGINPKDIVFEYLKVRPAIKAFIKESDNAALGQVMDSFVTYLATTRPPCMDDVDALKNLAMFFQDLPLDTSAVFITCVDNYGRTTPAFLYLTKLHKALLDKFPKYDKEFYQKVQDLSDQVK